MSWADKVKATALATAAERAATPARRSVDELRTWNPCEVWLSRVQPPRARVALTSMSEPPTPPPQAIAPRDWSQRSCSRPIVGCTNLRSTTGHRRLRVGQGNRLPPPAQPDPGTKALHRSKIHRTPDTRSRSSLASHASIAREEPRRAAGVSASRAALPGHATHDMPPIGVNSTGNWSDTRCPSSDTRHRAQQSSSAGHTGPSPCCVGAGWTDCPGKSRCRCWKK